MKAISMFKREGVISVTVATIVSLFFSYLRGSSSNDHQH